ncbi:MAG: hydrogenase nickel incorporation protein HypB [Magnetococcales bacterium]|nr:hydrogenase nickel incorporation protein HypB [Magnetococcales bacterium]
MCETCGCSADAHAHPHPHPHPEEDDGRTRTLAVAQRVLAENDRLAAANRRWLAERSIPAVNLISAPGAGKTRLLERTLEGLRGRLPCAVIVGDVQTDTDARRLQGRGAPVWQIETLDACHLDAQRIARILPRAVPEGTRLLLVENVGNLVCPAAFDLGETLKVALLSVTEGEDKPLKYPTLFHRAPVVVITKTDLIPHLSWNAELCRDNILRVRPDARILSLSAQTGAGLESWLQFLTGLRP